VSSDAAASGSSQDVWTVRRILQWTTAHLQKHGSSTPRLDAEILLAHSRNCRRIELYTRFDEVLSSAERATMRDLVRRRAQSQPVAYLVGHREFFSLEFRVTPDVLIPRPETETLVVELLTLIEHIPAPRVADIGTGSGCIAVAAASNNARLQMTAVDISAAALAIARQNAERQGVLDRVRLVEGDLLAPLVGDEPYHAIVSNPPYIAEGELASLPLDVSQHEPHGALIAGQDGLSVIRRLVKDAPAHLADGGALLMEISPEQADAVVGLLKSQGNYGDVRVIKDYSSQPRVVLAYKG
jgi:release factor glutamine methyltransferase